MFLSYSTPEALVLVLVLVLARVIMCNCSCICALCLYCIGIDIGIRASVGISVSVRMGIESVSVLAAALVAILELALVSVTSHQYMLAVDPGGAQKPNDAPKSKWEGMDQRGRCSGGGWEGEVGATSRDCFVELPSGPPGTIVQTPMLIVLRSFMFISISTNFDVSCFRRYSCLTLGSRKYTLWTTGCLPDCRNPGSSALSVSTPIHDLKRLEGG